MQKCQKVEHATPLDPESLKRMFISAWIELYCFVPLPPPSRSDYRRHVMGAFYLSDGKQHRVSNLWIFDHAESMFKRVHLRTEARSPAFLVILRRDPKYAEKEEGRVKET
jgi:hypothetical protein